MRYLSVCSGIEAATSAWHDLGWKPVAFSEIDPFPAAVLKHHYPEVPNLGDMTKFKEWNLGTIELLVGGTPCQSFSVAGRRKGLDDPRGNLMLTFGAIARHFAPRWLVWENVPGVLSSNRGRDFGTFLGMLGELGYGFAYRVLDAQYFGVAQRRRRVFVVGCLGDWRPAAAVLFERDSLRRDTAPSREAGQTTTGTVTTRSGPSGRGGVGSDEACGGFVQPVLSHDPAPCLETTCHDYSRADGFTMVGHPISIQGNLIGRDAGGPQGVGASDDGVMYTLTKADVHGVAQPIAFTANQRDEVRELDVAGALAAEPGMRQQTFLAQPITAAFKGGQGSGAGGIGYSEYVAPTLPASDGGNRTPTLLQSMAVRRLTPQECERLQGFPDGHTQIPWRGKPAEECPDGPRYKALGNSMAVPVMAWIGKRIEMVNELPK